MKCLILPSKLRYGTLSGEHGIGTAKAKMAGKGNQQGHDRIFAQAQARHDPGAFQSHENGGDLINEQSAKLWPSASWRWTTK